MTHQFKNNAVGALASSINDSVLSLTLQSGQGALFPQPSGSSYFYATIIADDNTKEVVKVTARSTNTFTIVRAQDNTSARAFDAGDRVELRLVAANMENFAQKDSANDFADTVSISKAAGNERILEFRSGSDVRWRSVVTSESESGSDAGSNFELRSYGDDELLQATAMQINRSTGIMTVLAGFKVGSNKADAFATATALVFRQAAAPTGWTKVTTYNDAVLRVVSGTPSQKADASKGLTDLLKSRTIARANLPNVTLNITGWITGTTNNPGDHGHPYREARVKDSGVSNGGLAIQVGNEFNVGPYTGTPERTNGRYIGGGGAHTHTVSGTCSGTSDSINGNVTQTDFDLAVNYVDLYIATKDA